MPYTPPADLPRCAVVDLGSNSVRLVVFEGRGRNPVPIFNEKAVLRLGRGLQATGRLNEDGVAQALTVMNRYAAIARAMGAEPFEVLATAAVRDAENGPDFVASAAGAHAGRADPHPGRRGGGGLAAEGLLCGIPAADGILADIGGGSLELVRLDRGQRGAAKTLRLGVIRLAERAGRRPACRRGPSWKPSWPRCRWLQQAAGRDLYLVGGAWRALARMHIAQTGYPLNMVHHYTIGRDEARDLTGVIAGSVAARRWSACRACRAGGWRTCRSPRWCCGGCCAARGARRVVFSANGLREGWYMRLMPPEERAHDPLLAAGWTMRARFGRDPALPPALLAWTDPLFPGEAGEARRLREAACWMSDIGSHDHPGIPRRAGVPAHSAPARHRAGPPCARLPGADAGDALRGRAGRAVPGAGAHAAERGGERGGRPSWGWRCGWPTRCPPARRTCWRARGCGRTTC